MTSMAIGSLSSLREKQRENLTEMVKSIDSIWKVLIFDKNGQQIFSTLFKKEDLRELGITVHLMLESNRAPIRDVPALYFVEPTKESISRIANDLAGDMFDSVYLNFTSTLSRSLLEELVSLVCKDQSYGKIIKVFDQYINFISLEDYLFSFPMHDSFYFMNRPHAKDAEMESFVDRIVMSLFSVIVSYGSIPFIKAQRGNIAEVVAQKLESKLRDHLLNSRQNLFSDSYSSSLVSRPVLILLDRQFDLSSMLQHSWSYQTLVHDILKLNLNKLSIPNEVGVEAKRIFDIDCKDFFWRENAFQPFPNAVTNVDKETNKYAQEVEGILRSTGGGTLEEVNEMDNGLNPSNLKAAITVLPKLKERKRIIDLHMNIATNLLKQIGERELDSFFAAEDNITKQTKVQILDLISFKHKGAPEDKMRLFLVYYLANRESISSSDMAEYKESLGKSGCDMKPLNYIENLMIESRMTTGGFQASASSGRNVDFLGGKFKIPDNFKDSTNIIGGALGNLMSGVKNLLPTSNDLPVTKAVESLMEGTESSDDYKNFDPRASPAKISSQDLKGMGRTGSQQKVATFQDAIVFIIGGGNYLEYQNLQEFSKRNLTSKKNITYGSTEIIAPSEMLKQFSDLVR